MLPEKQFASVEALSPMTMYNHVLQYRRRRSILLPDLNGFLGEEPIITSK